MATYIRINIESFNIPWQLGTTYHVNIDEGFAIDNAGELSAGRTNITSFTTKSQPPQITSLIQVTNAVNITNGTIKLIFDRNKINLIGGFYLYKVGSPLDILIVPNKPATIQNYQNGESYLILNYTGKLERNTTYYIMTDPEPISDADNFKFSGILNNNILRFTTGDTTFPDFDAALTSDFNIGASPKMLWVNSATLNSDFNLLASAKLAGITSNAVLTSNFSLIASITPPILVNAQLNADFNINNVVPKYTARGRGTLTSDFNINNVVPKYTAISRGTLTSNFNLSIVAQLNTMRFVIDTLSGPKSVFLAIDADEPVTILWGDPSGIDTIQSGGVNHVYTASGSYTVRILGKLTSFVNENANITSVSKLPESLERLKLGSRIRDNNLTSVPTILPPSITDLSYCFVRCKNFNQNISNWNTSNVTNMYYMFGEASAFNQPIGSWNTANVTTMDYMFYNIGSSPGAFDQNISNWNVSLIPTKPSQFDTNTPANWTTAEKPVWGTSGS